MAEITTTQSFSDGDTVTATKLNNIQANASIQPEAITNRTAETTVDQANDLLLMYDASATALKKVSPSNLIKAGTASDFPITGNATIGGTLGVTGASTLSGNTTIGGTLGVTGASTLSGNTAVLGTLGVSDTISATKSTGTGLAVTNNATIGGTLAVTGAITASSTVNGTTIPTSKTLVTADDTQTLTGKTVNLSSNTLTGTLAQFNTSCSDADFVSLAGSETLTNKTLTSPVISGGTINNVAIGGTTAAAGSFTTLSATSPITTQAGTFASPAIQPTGDTNTGIFFPAADTIAFSEGGTESMRIDSSGNVGIGTTSPAYGLDVNKSSARINGSFATLAMTDSVSGATSGGFIRYISNSSAGSYSYQINTASAGDFSTAINAYTITSAGNVGIGTTSPSARLDITKTSPSSGQNEILRLSNLYNISGINEPTIRFDNGLGTVGWNVGAQVSGSTYFRILDTGTERLRIDSSGNVGIGTTSPISKLHVGSSVTNTGVSATFGAILCGDAQTTANLTDSGNHGASLFLKSTGGASGDGGAILFGANNQNNRYFAAIKGFFTNGNNSTTGDICFSTRNAITDTSLTERLRIGSSGQIGIGGANYGTSGQVLTSNGTGSAPSWQTSTIADASITPAKLSQPLTRATAVASTSGTVIDFTGIPSWVRRITVMFASVSTTSGDVLLQLGTGTTPVTSGYQNTASGSSYGTNATTGTSSTTGFRVAGSNGGNLASGSFTILLISGTTYVSSYSASVTGSVTGGSCGGGWLDLGGSLGMVRLTPSAGNFDSGTINIMYEG